MDNITNKMKKKMLLLLLPFLASCERTYPGRPTLSMDKEKLTDLFTNVKNINDKLAYRVRVGKSEKDAYFYEDKNKIQQEKFPMLMGVTTFLMEDYTQVIIILKTLQVKQSLLNIWKRT